MCKLGDLLYLFPKLNSYYFDQFPLLKNKRQDRKKNAKLEFEIYDQF